LDTAFLLLLKAELRLVKKALIYASKLGINEEVVSEKEHKKFMIQIGSKGGITPVNSLKAYRLREELTQKELAKASGISQSNISAMEKGRRPIGLNIAKKLAKILNCEYKKLV
jgi:DNA-binding XRE family transcriptional regulator